MSPDAHPPSPAVPGTGRPARTVQDFVRAARAHGITEWRIGNCTFCGYRIGYLFDGPLVFFDAGCWCVRVAREPRDWFDVAQHYRIQTNPLVIARYDRFWRWAS